MAGPQLARRSFGQPEERRGGFPDDSNFRCASQHGCLSGDLDDHARPVERMRMTEEGIARLRAHRRNIDRYRRLLETKLSEIERQYLERRLSEEQATMVEIHVQSVDPRTLR